MENSPMLPLFVVMCLEASMQEKRIADVRGTVAFVEGDRVYLMNNVFKGNGTQVAGGRLNVGRVAEAEVSVVFNELFPLMFQNQPGPSSVFRVMHNVCWYSSCGIPNAFLTRIPVGQIAQIVQWQKNGGPLADGNAKQSAEWFWCLGPIQDKAPLRNGFPNRKDDDSAWEYFDYYPRSHTSLLVIMIRDGRLEVHAGEIVKVKGDQDKDADEERINWVRRLDEEVESSPFREPFRTWIQNDDWFFLTQSGKLYVARKRADGKGRVATLVWNDNDRPLVGAIEFVREQKVFLYGKDQRAIINAGSFYFELSDKPSVKDIAPGELRPLKAPQPLKTLAEYTQLIREREKLPAKKPDAKP
jgi:hypothetical protein